MQVDIELGKAAALQRQGNFVEAVKIFQSILKAAPNTPIAHYNLALIYKTQRKTGAAEKAFKTALKLNEQYTLAWRGYVHFLADRGKIKEAVRAAIMAVKAQNLSVESKQHLADQLALARTTKLGNTGKEALSICLGDNNLDFDGAVFAAIEYLESHSILSKFFTFDTDFPTLDEYCQKKSDAIIDALRDPILIKIFSNLILPTRNFEKGVLNLRQFLTHMSSDISCPKIIEARALIALQMELREYSAPSLSTNVNFDGDLDALSITAMYEPIPAEKSADFIEKYVEEFKSLPLAKKLFKKFTFSAQGEHFQSLGNVKDETSLRIQSQYEENPYPRWFGIRKTGSQTLHSLMSQIFPHLKTQGLAQTPQILVAGCGTGRHALRTAVRIKESQVFAIDLSKTSLTYAKMKAQELDIFNIEFAQSDINELPQEIGKFDLIECCGVLHHMSNPAKAWKHLIGFLDTRGVMKIALYSRLARQDVFAARTLLNIDPESVTLEDIRNARQTILDLPEDHPAKSVSNDLDFYSAGGCRDFLFNRQETCYSLPEIKVMLANLNLEFLGFEFTETAILTRYKTAFPQDPNAVDLDNWGRLEKANPMLFRGMYQFWCRPIRT